VKPIVDSIADKDLKAAFSASVNEFLQQSVFGSSPFVSMSAIIDSSQVLKKITEYVFNLILLGVLFKLNEEMILRVK
jgi:hypothetical protein